MVLTSSAAVGTFGGEFAVYTADIIVSSPSLMNAPSLSNFENTTMVARIDESLAMPTIALFGGIKTSGIYIITPTETGFSAFGTEG